MKVRNQIFDNELDSRTIAGKMNTMGIGVFKSKHGGVNPFGSNQQRDGSLGRGLKSNNI